jgi:uncharacterized protein (DUF2141 family)
MFRKTAYDPQYPLKGVIYSSKNQDVSFNSDIKVDPISLNFEGLGESVNSFANISEPAFKSATFLTMIVSLSASIALIKIFQMMDYMILFSVAHPYNF